MSLPLLIALLAILFFGLLTISSSIQEDKLKKRIKALEDAEKRRKFEEKLHSEIQDSLDYSLDIKKILSPITAHLPNIFTYATVSTLIVNEHSLEFSADAVETVSHTYMENVKESMIQSLTVLEKRSFREVPVHENLTGKVLHQAQTTSAAYVIHLPLMLHNSVAAILTLTSSEAHHFPTDRIESLQKVIAETSQIMNKLDAAVQVEKGRLTAMMSSLKDGLFMIDKHNTLQFINPMAKQMLSLHKEPLLTMDVLSALPINIDFGSKIQAVLRTNQAIETGSVILKNRQLRCGIFPVHDSTGNILGVSVVMNDETLKNSIPRMKEDFTNIIVHELRSPLTTIKASSELLKSRTEFSKEEQQKLNQLIYTQANKLLNDVNQILDAAKLESGVFAINKHRGNLKELIEEVTAAFQAEAQSKVINLATTVEHSLPAFSYDPHYLGLALTNVIANSIKFTGTGGSVHIQAKQKQDSVVITVTDTGGGIPKDKQHKLFNKFSQLSEASAQIGKGLGLYVVKGILEAHGGKVEMDSDTGRGTTITMTLPMTNASHTPFAQAPKAPDNQRMVN